jgi:membrane protein required for beta-lactamase induction
MAKVLVVMCLGLMLWVWVGMVGRHRANIRGGLWLLDVHAHADKYGLDRMSPMRAVTIYALLFLDSFSVLWAYAAALVGLPFLAMSAASCFAWSPVPDMISVEELRAMVKTEEARAIDEEAVVTEEAGEGLQPLLLRLLWNIQGILAGLGERMVAFASRQC